MHEDDDDENQNTTSAHSPRLSPFHVPLEHQLAILEAQIGLAIEFRRNISMHSVKAQQASVDLLKRLVKQHGDQFHAVSLDFHSCGLSAEMWGDIQVRFPLSLVQKSPTSLIPMGYLFAILENAQ